LVDKTLVWPPPKYFVIGPDSVDSRLRVDSQQFVLAAGHQRLFDHFGLLGERVVRERHFLDFASDVVYKDLSDMVVLVDDLAPHLLVVFIVHFGLARLPGVRLESSFFSRKSSRARCSPTAIGKLIPLLGLVDVTLVVVGPEDRAHTLFFSAGGSGHLEGQLLRLVDNARALNNLDDGGL